MPWNLWRKVRCLLSDDSRKSAPSISTPAVVGSQPPLVVLGSSSSEIFDYIFGDNPDYYPFWASGWSARGLRQEKPDGYLATIMQPIDRHAIVIMNFGATDIAFNTPYKVQTAGFYDLPAMVSESRAGILHARDRLNRMGFTNIYACFVAPIARPAPGYANKINRRVFAPRLLGRMYLDLAEQTAKRMPVLNFCPDMVESETSPVLALNYMRAPTDTHPHYVKVQDIAWQHLKDVPGMLPRRDPPHTELYEHVAHGIGELRAANVTRPRTCR